MTLPEVTPEDVTEWRQSVGLEPAPTTRLLIFTATNLVGDWLQNRIWDPNNQTHVAAIRNAICWLVSIWQEADINPLSEGLKATVNTVSSASLLGGSFSNANPAQTARRRASITSALPTDIIAYLIQAGIRVAPVQVVG